MSDFQKNLEHYYDSMNNEPKLYYERRAKQFNSDSSIVKRRVITIQNQIKSFSAMFRQDPHMVTTYFGRLASDMGKVGSGLCEKDHQYASYYLAGLTYYKLDSLFNSGDIDKRFKKVRFYLIMLVPLIATSLKFPPLNSRSKVEAYCNDIRNKLNDDNVCKKIFLTAVNIIDKSGATIEDKQSLKSKSMTTQILEAYEGEKV